MAPRGCFRLLPEYHAAVHTVSTSHEAQPRLPDGGLDAGEQMYRLAERLFPICRSITGEGVRQTLAILQDHLPAMTITEVPSGTKCFDWTVPDEWNIRDAYVMDETGRRVVDFREHNLHVVGYSVPVDTELSLEELQPHLHSLPDQPEAIPYVTSYYAPRWGFCLRHRDREALQPGRYRVVIDSTLAPGHLTYGELRIQGQEPEEVFLSTYVCHPSLANNELSGPVVATYLAKWLQSGPRRHSYRIVFAPETIGALTYASRNLEDLRARVVAGFVLTCVGDDRAVSFLPSRLGSTLADRAALHVLEHRAPGFRRYSFLDRGSDERQYCSPGIDLPMVSIMRTKYGEYPEYHTSLDDLSVVSPQGLEGAFTLLRQTLEVLEANRVYRATCLGEPQLGRRGLYPTLSTRNSGATVRTMMNVLAYCDGNHDLIDIGNRIGVCATDLVPTVAKLCDAGLIEEAGR